MGTGKVGTGKWQRKKSDQFSPGRGVGVNDHLVREQKGRSDGKLPWKGKRKEERQMPDCNVGADPGGLSCGIFL